MTTHNFVAADAQPIAVEPSIIRRQDVVETSQQLIRAYSDQQKMLLGKLQDETIGGRGGFLSDADMVLERRKTSRMYLVAYGFISGLTMGGLAFLAHVAGNIDGILSLGGWMFGTGAMTLALTWSRHGDEFAHSPEGIARHMLDWHGEIASYEAETRRLSLQWEFDAEQRRQQAAAQAAADARQQAELRIRELESRRKAIDAQHERRFMAVWQTETAQERPQTAIAAQAYQNAENDAETQIDAPTPDSGHSSTWRDSLIVWVAQLYADPAAMTDAGIIRQRVPWSARSTWLESDKRDAKRLCCDLRPALIVQGDGGRWRLRREMFPDADLALQVLRQRLTDD